MAFLINIELKNNSIMQIKLHFHVIKNCFSTKRCKVFFKKKY